MCVACTVAGTDGCSVVSFVWWVSDKHSGLCKHDAGMYSCYVSN